MTLNRKLVYDFLDLAHHIQMRIGKEMGFTAPKDDETDIRTFVRWFGEAKEAEQLEKLRAIVAREKETANSF